MFLYHKEGSSVPEGLRHMNKVGTELAYKIKASDCLFSSLFLSIFNINILLPSFYFHGIKKSL